uniref:Uncharacterized protein n=1 Tax=viral metagenome TaxID=1070528 RepID=A0A6C0LFJ1_9ZZZZ
MSRLLETQKLGRVLQAHKSEYLKIPSGIIIKCSATNWKGKYDFDFQPGESLPNWDQDIHYANQISISSSGDKILMLLIERSGMNDAIVFLFKDIHGYYEEINQELAFSSLRNHFYNNLDDPLKEYFDVAQEEVSMIMVSRFAIQSIPIHGNPLDYKTIQTELAADAIKPIMCAVSFTDNDAGREAEAAAAETAPIEAAAREAVIRETAARETAARGRKRGPAPSSAAAAYAPSSAAVSSTRGRNRGIAPSSAAVSSTPGRKRGPAAAPPAADPPAADIDPELEAYWAAYADYAASSAAARAPSSAAVKKSRTGRGGKKRKGKMTKRKMMKKRKTMRKRKMTKR